MDWILYIFVILLFLAGIAGSILPVLPGPPIALAGVLIAHWLTPINYSAAQLWQWSVLVALITALDYFLPVWSVKWGGGSKYAANGATIGLVLGIFLGPFGIIFGPFFGAFAGELYDGKTLQSSFKPAMAAFLGFVGGTILKLTVGLAMLVNFIYKWYQL